MKNLLLLAIPVLLLLSCNSARLSKKRSQEDYFKVEVIQNGKIVKERNNIIQLEKKSFKYRLTLIKTRDVFVSNSWETHYYDYPDTENIFQCDQETAEGINEICRFVSVKTGSEDKFNTNKDIYVGDQTYHSVWFYDENIDWYRMDRGVKVEDGVVYAEVTVENIYDLDKRDEGGYDAIEYNYPIERISQDIYVVFATSHYERGMEYPEELQREKFILKFE
ncbi:MAG: hypothetical protein AAF806_16755 [Bacteroidota bacterium]